MDDHFHKYFMFQVKADFVPVQASLFLSDGTPVDRVNLYERIEYGVLACNCGEALKTRVKDGDKDV